MSLSCRSKMGRKWTEDSHLFRTFCAATNCDKLSEPAIGDDHRRGQLDAALAECRHTSIEHALYPVQFVAARCSRAWRIWTPNGKVHGHHQLTLADNDDQQHPINTGEHPVFLPTPPGTHEAQLLAVLF